MKFIDIANFFFPAIGNARLRHALKNNGGHFPGFKYIRFAPRLARFEGVLDTYLCSFGVFFRSRKLCCFFIKVRLKNPPHVPLFLKDDWSIIVRNEEVEAFLWNKDLVYIRARPTPFSHVALVEELKNNFLTSVEPNLKKLISVAGKVDAGLIDMGDQLSRRSRALASDWVVGSAVAAITIGVIIFVCFKYL